VGKLVNVNADMGESFGVYRIANDDALLDYVPTANIACGFHAGDPSVMRETVAKAVDKGVDVGAHVGLPDLVGFGRRRMAVSPEELCDDITYQIGALEGFVRRAGGKMVHVKPHGSLFAMCGEEERYAEALVNAVVAFDKDLILVLAGDVIDDVAARQGIKVLHEGYCDLQYDLDGSDIIERVKEAWDPALVAKRALQLVQSGTATAIDGSVVTIRADTICIHGDAPNAKDVVRAVVETLESEDVSLVGLRDLA